MTNWFHSLQIIPWLLKRVLPHTTMSTTWDWSLLPRGWSVAVEGCQLISFPRTCHSKWRRRAYIQWLTQGGFQWGTFWRANPISKVSFWRLGTHQLKNRVKFIFLLSLCSWACVSFLHIDVQIFLHFSAKGLSLEGLASSEVSFPDFIGEKIGAGVWGWREPALEMNIPTAGGAGKGGVFWSVGVLYPTLMWVAARIWRSRNICREGALLPFQQILRRYVDTAFVKHTHSTHKYNTLVWCVSKSASSKSSDHLDCLLKHRLLEPHLPEFGTVKGAKMSISKNFPGDSDAAVQNHCVRENRLKVRQQARVPPTSSLSSRTPLLKVVLPLSRWHLALWSWPHPGPKRAASPHHQTMLAPGK